MNSIFPAPLILLFPTIVILRNFFVKNTIYRGYKRIKQKSEPLLEEEFTFLYGVFNIIYPNNQF